MYNLNPFSYSFGEGGKGKRIFLEEVLSFDKNEIVAIVGPSGGGKSTLLKLLKGIIPEYSSGVLEGVVTFHGKPLNGINFQENLKRVLYLFQNPFSQLIYPTPEEEFLFSMENFNYSNEEMNNSIEKFENLFNLKNIWGKKNSQLSNGECQKLVLASLLAINPEVLLLDEPTAFLDPEARSDFYNFLNKIRGERLVIIVDHHVEEIKDIVTRVIEVSIDGKIASTIELEYFEEKVQECFNLENFTIPHFTDLQLKMDHMSFGHVRKQKLFENLNTQFNSSEIIAIKGKNGAGKSSLFKVISGIINPTFGKVSLEMGTKKFINKNIFSNVGFVFQNPESHFFYDTINEELEQSFKYITSPKLKEEILKRFFHQINLDKSPFLLSEGEKRRLSILMTVFLGKSLLLLDEPTFGQDKRSVYEISQLMRELKKLGVIQVFISHDDLFIKETADRVFVLQSGMLNEVS